MQMMKSKKKTRPEMNTMILSGLVSFIVLLEKG